MKTHKTPSNQRGTYTYHGAEDNFTLKPGMIDPATGYVLTEEDIKLLHLCDDAEVRNNLKNTRVPVQDWEKQGIEDWKAAHPGEELPTRKHISINEVEEADDEDNGGVIAMASMKVFADAQETEDIDRLHEVVAMLTSEQQELYRRIVINGEDSKSVAKDYGIDESAIRHRMGTIRKMIKKYF